MVRPDSTPLPTYAQRQGWRRYFDFVPESLGFRDDTEIVEEWWHHEGHPIHLDRFPSPDSPLVVMVLHGAGGYGRMLASIGVLCQANGYEVVAPDLPGYGLSPAEPPEIFHCDYWVQCMSVLVTHEIERTGKPIVLFGLSMGGFLAYQVAARGKNVAGLIVTTLADPEYDVVREQFTDNWLLEKLGLPLLTNTGELLAEVALPIKWFTPMEKIANEPGLAQLICDDPLGGGNAVPIGFLRSVFTQIPDVPPEEFDFCPVLYAQPDADAWTTEEASRPFFDRIRGDKKLVRLENCGHFPIEEPGVGQLQDAVLEFLSRL